MKTAKFVDRISCFLMGKQQIFPQKTRSQLSIDAERITPTIARQYLATMRFNRPLDEKRVGEYAELMRSRKWREYSRFLEFTIEGDLINGQHRLQAVIESGRSQLFVVVRGLPIAVR